MKIVSTQLTASKEVLVTVEGHPSVINLGLYEIPAEDRAVMADERIIGFKILQQAGALTDLMHETGASLAEVKQAVSDYLSRLDGSSNTG